MSVCSSARMHSRCWSAFCPAARDSTSHTRASAGSSSRKTSSAATAARRASPGCSSRSNALVMISTAVCLPWSSISPRQSSGASKYAWNVRRGTRARAHTRAAVAPANPCSAATSTNAWMICTCFGSSTRRRGAAGPPSPAGPVRAELSARPSAAGPVGAELCVRRSAAGRPSAAGASPLEDSSISRLSRPCFRFPPTRSRILAFSARARSGSLASRGAGIGPDAVMRRGGLALARPSRQAGSVRGGAAGSRQFGASWPSDPLDRRARARGRRCRP
jgi:hypothetical protein